MTIKTTLVNTALTIVASEDKATILSIFNLMSQQMMTVKIQGEQSIDVSRLSNGLYIIRTDKGEMGRFLKE